MFRSETNSRVVCDYKLFHTRRPVSRLPECTVEDAKLGPYAFSAQRSAKSELHPLQPLHMGLGVAYDALSACRGWCRACAELR